MKPADIKPDTCIDYSVERNNKDPEFRNGDNKRISKYKNVFEKAYTPNLYKEFFEIKKVKSATPWIYVINDLSNEKIVGKFHEKDLQETSQKEFRIE